MYIYVCTQLTVEPGHVQGGALAKLLPIFQVGGGGILGSGTQYFSWVSLVDVVKALIFIVNKPSL